MYFLHFKQESFYLFNSFLISRCHSNDAAVVVAAAAEEEKDMETEWQEGKDDTTCNV